LGYLNALFAEQPVGCGPIDKLVAAGSQHASNRMPAQAGQLSIHQLPAFDPRLMVGKSRVALVEKGIKFIG